MESLICNFSVWQHVKLSRSVPEIHSHVAGTFSNKQNKHGHKHGHRRARDQNLLCQLSHSSESIQMEFGILLTFVGLVRLILSGPIVIQGREPCLCDSIFLKKQFNSDKYRLISFKHSMMTETTAFSI